MKVEGSTIKTYAISDGQYMYTWNDQNKTAGLKIKIDEAESAAKDIPDTPGSAGGDEPVDVKGKAVDMEKEMNYNCTPSTISDADVTPPSDVKFVDMAETIKGLQDKFKDFKLPEQ